MATIHDFTDLFPTGDALLDQAARFLLHFGAELEIGNQVPRQKLDMQVELCQQRLATPQVAAAKAQRVKQLLAYLETLGTRSASMDWIVPSRPVETEETASEATPDPSQDEPSPSDESK